MKTFVTLDYPYRKRNIYKVQHKQYTQKELFKKTYGSKVNIMFLLNKTHERSF